MAERDPRGPGAASFDWSLVDHDGLMTPLLVTRFGPIEVRLLHTADLGPTERRRVSQLLQRDSGTVILEAEMVLNLTAIPGSILTALHESAVPFGQLLIEAGIPALSVDRKITALPSAPPRLRRRHRLVNARTGQELCKISETLSPLPVLLAAHAAFAGGSV